MQNICRYVQSFDQKWYQCDVEGTYEEKGFEEFWMRTFPSDGGHRDNVFAASCSGGRNKDLCMKMKGKCGVFSDFPYGVLLSANFLRKTTFLIDFRNLMLVHPGTPK